MKKLNALAMLASFTLLSGCAYSDPDPVRQYTVIYDSIPQSATVICNNEQKGYTPVRLRYNIRYSQLRTARLEECKAIWASGVEATYNNIGIERRKVAKAQHRQEEMQIDMQFDLQQKQAKAGMRQARADAQYKQQMLKNQKAQLELQKKALQQNQTW